MTVSRRPVETRLRSGPVCEMQESPGALDQRASGIVNVDTGPVLWHCIAAPIIAYIHIYYRKHGLCSPRISQIFAGSGWNPFFLFLHSSLPFLPPQTILSHLNLHTIDLFQQTVPTRCLLNVKFFAIQNSSRDGRYILC